MIRYCIVVICITLLSGCTSFGPSKIPSTRMDYNRTINESNNEEMLLNLVRVKYFEQPFFLQVGSISASFNYNISAGLTAEIPDQRDILKGIYSKYTPAVTGKYTDAPTITYTPSQGKTYAQQFLEEIDLDNLSILMKSGWDISNVFEILVARIGNLNHLFDLRTGYIPGQQDAFMQFVKLMQEIDQRNDIDLTTYAAGKDKPNVTIMTLWFKDEDESRRLSKLLGVDVRAHRDQQGRLVSMLHLMSQGGDIDEATAKNTVMLPIRMRNSLRAMLVVAQGIDVPQKYLDTKRAFDLRPTFKSLCNIQYSTSRPTDAFVAVHHQGYWYYIRNDDSRSKETFQLLLNIFALQSADPSKSGPVLTLPVGAQ
jgi:hypothetical protein